MTNEYDLDADYFIKLCAREFSPAVIRNQRPADLARAFARAARTACAEVLQESEFTQQLAPPHAAEQPSKALLAELRKRLQWYDGVDFVRMADVECALAEAVSAVAEQPDIVRIPIEALRRIHRDLDSCQKVIWLAGCRPHGYGFDPQYVTDAQARLKEIDALLAGGEA